MKTVTRSNIHLMAATILTAALAVPVAAQQVPFKGALQGHVTDSNCSPPQATCVVVTTTGTGIGAILGQFSFSEEITINLVAFTLTGSGHCIAANGDSIDTTIMGSVEGTADPDVVNVTEINTITGGTGRFARAQRSFTVESLGNVVTFMRSGSFHGTITSPGAAH